MDYASTVRAIRNKTFEPRPKITVSEWADNYRKLSPESSSEPGQWHTSRTEYLRGILDAVTDTDIETVVVMSSAQVGKTEIILNAIGYHIDWDPCPMLVLQPTQDMGSTFSKDRLSNMLRDTTPLQNKVAPSKSRDSENTILHKSFAGGHVSIVGANSPTGLASRPIRIVMLDEVDRYPASAGKEGDPVSLANKRTTTFWNRKAILVSTPTIKGLSRIEAAYHETDQRRFNVPCHDCGTYQPLQWAQVKWSKKKVDDEDRHDSNTARYECIDCQTHWTDAQRWNAVKKGQWEATATAENPKSVGFHLNEIYSPWVRLEEMVARFLEAKRLPENLKTFINTALGETWEEQGESPDNAGLIERREDYKPDAIPNDVVLLTAGIDTQDDRLEIEVVGWGAEYESWNVDYQVFEGNPAGPAVWKQLDDYLTTKFKREDKRELRIKSACIDSGGHYTQEVYNWAGKYKNKQLPVVRAIKGQAGAGRPIIQRGKTQALIVGVDSAKERVYTHLVIQEPGPGYCHFPNAREPYYFDQLTAEKKIIKFNKGFPYASWVNPNKARNEALDCRVYAHAAYELIKPNIPAITATVEKQNPINTNTQTPPPTSNVEPEKKQLPRRPKRQGWMKNGNYY